MTVDYKINAKRPKRRKRRAPLLVPIILVAAALLGVGGYFGYHQFLRFTHPIKYQKYVEKYAAQNKLDKYFVYAVIKTESGFDPSAESGVKARGLMQIMEETFEWIKYRLDDDDAVFHDMYDPETNIRYGCYLLGFLFEEFGNADCVAAAYHAGRGNVNKWLADKNYSSDGKHLDKIPISDTAHYVNKINKALGRYKRLYDNS